jgi:hypothetical protein
MGFSYIKNKKACLTADQKIRRVQWVMEHLHDDWTRIVFSDETTIQFVPNKLAG